MLNKKGSVVFTIMLTVGIIIAIVVIILTLSGNNVMISLIGKSNPFG